MFHLHENSEHRLINISVLCTYNNSGYSVATNVAVLCTKKVIFVGASHRDIFSDPGYLSQDTGFVNFADRNAFVQKRCFYLCATDQSGVLNRFPPNAAETFHRVTE